MMLLRSHTRQLVREQPSAKQPMQLVKRLSQQTTNQSEISSQRLSRRRKSEPVNEAQLPSDQSAKRVRVFDRFRLENQPSYQELLPSEPEAELKVEEEEEHTDQVKDTGRVKAKHGAAHNNRKKTLVKENNEPGSDVEDSETPKPKRSPPPKWQQVLKGIEQMRSQQVANVDVDGVEAFYDDTKFDLHVTRFHVLISAMLSSQTKDPVTAAAMRRLTSRGLTVQAMLDIDENDLVELIRPVSFLNRKAKHIKQVAVILKKRAEQRGDVQVDIPDSYEELIALPGVGPKMAHLVMSCAWKNTVGICVDTHVHRICNRLGWVKSWNKKNPKAQDPEKTREELEQWLPREHWATINPLLVGFGQTICAPRGPKCIECRVKDLCPSAFKSSI